MTSRQTGEQKPFSVRKLRNVILVCLSFGVAAYTATMFSLTQRLSERFGPQVRADLEWRVQRGAHELAHSVDVGILLEDPEVVRKAFGIYRLSEDVAAIVAVDADGQVIAQHGKPPKLDLFSGESGGLKRAEGYLISWAAVEIESTLVGKLAVVVTTQRLRDAQALLERASNVALVGGLAALVLGGVVVWFFTAAVAMRDARLSDYAQTLERKVADRTAELEQIHKQLVEASHQSGMAEIATNVLHNVGNVLNSVNVSATLISDTLKKSKVSGLAKAVAVMREHEGDLGGFFGTDARGKQLPGYLGKLSEHLAAEQEGLLKELAFLRQHVDHIKEIVAMQQTIATASALLEEVDLAQLVEESLRMSRGALNRHGVEVVRELEALPRLRLDKRKVLQILVNLISNAKQACRDSERSDKRIRLRLARAGGQIRVSVSDNGIGIPAENLTRIFQHGFTTREGGHGFGLHSAALAAKELGGALRVESDGPGQGATFTLELSLDSSTESTPQASSASLGMVARSSIRTD